MGRVVSPIARYAQSQAAQQSKTNNRLMYGIPQIFSHQTPREFAENGAHDTLLPTGKRLDVK